MILVFLLLLAAAWIGVFWPAVKRAKFDAPLSSAERFRRRLDLIAPRATEEGRWVLMPEHPDRLQRAAYRRGQRRRTRILIFLAVACAGTLVPAMASGGGMWELQLACDASLALYVFLLLDAKKRRSERATKVHSIGRSRATPAEEVRFYDPVKEGASGTS